MQLRLTRTHRPNRRRRCHNVGRNVFAVAVGDTEAVPDDAKVESVIGIKAVKIRNSSWVSLAGVARFGTLMAKVLCLAPMLCMAKSLPVCAIVAR